MKKAYLQTYGCQMNEHDSQRMAEVLAADGYVMTNCLEEADLVLLNTCSVRHNPENKVYSFLGTLKPLKRRRPDLIVGVAGCVAQQVGEELLRRAPVVDLVFGPDHYFALPEMLEAVRGGQRVVRTEFTHPSGKPKVDNFIPEQWIESGHVEDCKAYVAIMKGCNNFCSFCIVPYTRGREASREPQNVLAEVRDLVQRGAKEIWLLGQNVNSYNADGWRFYDLLEAASRVEGLHRLRFTSPHPKDWSNDLADLMAQRESICNQLHLPFQAGANRILALMNRRHTIEEYLSKIDYLKQRVPGVDISTDIIVGFPTETEEEFLETLRVVEYVGFAQAFSFKYSPRPGTKAADMPDDVPRPVKEDRLKRLIERQNALTDAQGKALVGSIQELLIDGRHPRDTSILNGRTGGHRPVAIRTEGIAIGDLVQVRITAARDHWLEGEVV